MSDRVLSAVVVVVLLVLAAGLAAGPDARARGVSAGPSGTSSWLNVTATADYGYQPDTIGNLSVNATIHVVFDDDDVLSHSFTIDSVEGWVIPTGYTPTQLDAFLTAHPPMYSTQLNGTGEESNGTFHSPATVGWYEFVCTVSGHFQDGMYGFVAFGEPVPANLTTPGRVGVGGAGLTPLDGALLAGGAVILLLGAVWAVRRRGRRPPDD